jgi:Rps23 Pro-64 3,4-dihydroxylase Tpa1-like proline 4-hydroxylase
VNGAIQCVRSIAVLYYFNNRPWQEGSGGETAFYESDREDAKPVCLIEPRNNRALAFEVSPLSYHAFQTNRSVRSCLAMWFHSPERYCQRRYKKDPH